MPQLSVSLRKGGGTRSLRRCLQLSTIQINQCCGVVVIVVIIRLPVEGDLVPGAMSTESCPTLCRCTNKSKNRCIKFYGCIDELRREFKVIWIVPGAWCSRRYAWKGCCRARRRPALPRKDTCATWRPPWRCCPARTRTSSTRCARAHGFAGTETAVMGVTVCLVSSFKNSDSGLMLWWRTLAFYARESCPSAVKPLRMKL